MTAGPPPPAAAAETLTIVPTIAPTNAPAAVPISDAAPPGAPAPVTPGEVTPLHRPASFGRTALAVFWSFFGVRKRRDHDSDAASLNPVHLIVAGVIGAALFVTLLLVLVNLVTRHK